jgi:hypothetical protein
MNWEGIRKKGKKKYTTGYGREERNNGFPYILTGDVRGVSKKFGEWYQKTNKIEDTKKTLLAIKIIVILHNTLLAKFIKLLFPRLKSIMKGARVAGVAAIQELATAVLRSILKRPLLAVSRSFMNVANSVL